MLGLKLINVSKRGHRKASSISNIPNYKNINVKLIKKKYNTKLKYIIKTIVTVTYI